MAGDNKGVPVVQSMSLQGDFRQGVNNFRAKKVVDYLQKRNPNLSSLVLVEVEANRQVSAVADWNR